MVTNDRDRLRRTFETAAEIYQQARPGYPAELFAELIRLTGLVPGDRLLEIGCATGQATAPLAGRDFLVTCVETGPRLARLARQNLAAFGGVDVIEADFETWRPLPGAGYDLVFAATAWHWIDPAVRYQRAWELLRAGGHLAFWSALHVFPADGDPFFCPARRRQARCGAGARAVSCASGLDIGSFFVSAGKVEVRGLAD